MEKGKEEQQIQAYATVRPFNKQEREQRSLNCLEVSAEEIQVNTLHGKKRYCFNKVFGINSTQKEIYKVVVEPIILEVLAGYNCTIFAYGQTGTGKTYTIVGGDTAIDAEYTADSESGIIPRTLDHLFELMKRGDMDYTIRVSFLELYNEILIDLLSTDDKNLKIFEDSKSKGTVQIQGLEQQSVHTKAQLCEILNKGNERRVTAATQLNAQSSRSHTVFMITLHTRVMTSDGEELIKTGKLNLVDLAGSENISRPGALEKGAREAGNINQSLLTLGRVIKGLVEKQAHIPYRESKLTRILQDSLGGKTKTTIIATVSPALQNVQETAGTLDYAFRARNITNRPEVNQRLSKTALVKRYAEEIDKLKKDLHLARSKEGVYLNPKCYHEMVNEHEEQKKKLLDTLAQCSEFQNRVAKLESIKEELERTYRVTKDDLTNSTQMLTRSKQILKNYLKQHSIDQDLLDKFDESQNSLFTYTQELNAALDKYINDHNLLRDKVDTLYKVIDKKNLTAKEFMKGINQSIDSVHTVTENFSKIAGNSCYELQQLNKNFNEDFHETLKSINRKNEEYLKTSENQIGNLKETLSYELNKRFQFLIQENESRKLLTNEISSMWESFNEIMKGELDLLKKNLNDRLKGDENNLKQISKKSNENIYRVITFSKEMEEQYCLQIQERDKQNEQLKNKITKLKTSFFEQFADLEQTCDIETKLWTKHCENTNRLTVNYCTETKVNLEKINGFILENHNRQSENTKCLVEYVDCIRTEFSKFKELDEKNKEETSKFSDKLNSHLENEKEEFEYVSRKLDEMLFTFQENVSGTKDQITEGINMLLTHNENVTDKLEYLEDSKSAFKNNSGNLVESTTNLIKYFSELSVEVKPLGSTPTVKKTKPSFIPPLVQRPPQEIQLDDSFVNTLSASDTSHSVIDISEDDDDE